MTRTFLHEFCFEMQKTYIKHAPGMLRATSVELDRESRWMNIHFGIAHERGVDRVRLRLSKEELCLDFSPGGMLLPVCLLGGNNPNWIESEMGGRKLNPKQKARIEILVRELFEVAQKEAQYLKLILKGFDGIQISKPVPNIDPERSRRVNNYDYLNEWG